MYLSKINKTVLFKIYYFKKLLTYFLFNVISFWNLKYDVFCCLVFVAITFRKEI